MRDKNDDVHTYTEREQNINVQKGMQYKCYIKPLILAFFSFPSPRSLNKKRRKFMRFINAFKGVKVIESLSNNKRSSKFHFQTLFISGGHNQKVSNMSFAHSPLEPRKPKSPTDHLMIDRDPVTGAPLPFEEIPIDPSKYIAPPIPRSFLASVGAYFRRSNSAAPELFLYKFSGYFEGATLRNAPNKDLLKAFSRLKPSYIEEREDAKNQLQATLDNSSTSKENKDRATVGTETYVDEKVGSIRSINIGSKNRSGCLFSSWFFSPTPRLINMLEIGTLRTQKEIQIDEKEEKLVLLHGYGAGTAFFYQNLKALAGHPDSRLYALDWLGMGRSSRVPFHISNKQAKTTETRVEAAESFFVQALEDWRKTMGLKKMTLIGHSLGGYLSIAYSLKYPQNVNRLILLSPAGIPEPPPEVMEEQVNGSAATTRTADLNDADRIADEVQQSQNDIVPESRNQRERDVNNTLFAASKSKRRGSNEVEERVQTLQNDQQQQQGVEGNQPNNNKPPPRFSSTGRNLVRFLWEQNLSPFAILRLSWIFGPMLTGSYTSRRFANLPEEELRAIHAYCYHIFTSKGSSEYCLAHILAPFGYARKPMVNRINALPKTLPITFIYGQRGIDWMDEKGGIESVKRLNESGNPFARCFAIPNAGHHVYLDNPVAFDTLLGKVLRGEVDDAGKAGVKARI